MNRPSPFSFRPSMESLDERIVPSSTTASLAKAGLLGAAQVATPNTQTTVPFQITGAGNAPGGLPLFPGGSGPFDSFGKASHLGKYSATDGQFFLDSIDFTTLTGTFHGSITFVAANGNKLACNFTGGQLTLTPTATGLVATFVATFTVDGAASTGRFAGASGSWEMTAVSEPLVPSATVPGYTEPFQFSWSGESSITLARGKK